MPLKIEDVLALTRAGYTRAEIDTMLEPTQRSEPAPTPAQEPETDPFKRLAEEIVKGIQSNNRQQNKGRGQGGQQDYIDMLNKIL